MKNENIGIYVTWALFGAGAGLTVGSILVSLLEKRRITKEMADVSKDIVERVEELKEEYSTYTREGLNDEQKQTTETTEKEKSLEESVREGVEEAATDQAQYAALAAIYDITPAQHQLYSRGIISLDQLEEVLAEDKQANVDYFNMGVGGNDVSIDELFAAEGMGEDVDPRYKVTAYIPEDWNDSMAFWEFALVGEFEVLARIHRSSRSMIPVEDIESVIPDDIYEQVLDDLRYGPDGIDVSPIYVTDYENNRRLSFGMFENQEAALSS